MGNERDYDGEYEKEKRKQPENEVSWDSLAKEDKVYEFTKLTPTPPDHYQKKQVTKNSLAVIEGYGASAYVPQFDGATPRRRQAPTANAPHVDSPKKQTESPKQNNKQSNKQGDRQKPQTEKKQGFFQRLFGGNRDNQQPTKQPESNNRSNVTNRTPRSRKPKKDTPTVANFKQQIKNRANAKLDENSQQVDRLIVFKGGKVRMIDNLSGHFRPTVEESLKIPELLKNQGFDVSGANLKLYEFIIDSDGMVDGRSLMVNEYLK